jgi:hypothetical protein
MTINVKTITDAQWFPLSATYEYDENLSLTPEHIVWQDGYNTFNHKIFEKSKDCEINRFTSLYLSQSGSFFDFFTELSKGPKNLGCYVILQIDGLYITVINDELIVNETPNDSYFRLYLNNDNTISIRYNEQYFTVNPYTLQIELIESVDDDKRYKFKYNIIDNSIVLIAQFENPLEYGPDNIERFVSYNSNNKKIMANGIIGDDDYILNNNYVITITGFEPFYIIDGLNRDQTWVRYYNDLYNKQENNTTLPNESTSVSGVKINTLIDNSYFEKINIDNQNMKINVANLKNIYTPEYDITIKP